MKLRENSRGFGPGERLHMIRARKTQGKYSNESTQSWNGRIEAIFPDGKYGNG
jgi:hypothetical protein